jgi:hypothetical protein
MKQSTKDPRIKKSSQEIYRREKDLVDLANAILK